MGADLQRQKDDIDAWVARAVNRVFAVRGTFVALQMAVLARLTFVDLDWDIMEPVTYFIATGYATIVFAYGVWCSKESTHRAVEDLLLTRRQVRAYAKYRFNHAAYVQLQRRVEVLRAELRERHRAKDLNILRSAPH
eukprot:NODE_5397_length_511_cov_307.590909_g4015_i0.p2 GENE.NODE_5397_length_511_cov_307.590909_g4015_i0~~NODE_5397_length_511_cov_307.590909_g4015_i0.p2  ORF type:complete len:148 (+),score=66.92 NODE_5397_length_511_cov_307.590909_g4015_i0:34-444(+)